MPRRPRAEAPPEAEAREPETLAQALERLDKLEFDLKLAIENTRLDLTSAERRFTRAQERLDAEADPSEALREEVAARRLQLSSAQRIVSLLEERIEGVQSRRGSRRRLDQLLGRRVSVEDFAEWESESVRDTDRIQRELTVKKRRVDELRQELEFSRERREELGPDAAEARWRRVQVLALEHLLDRYEEDLAGLEEQLRLERELASALDLRRDQLPLSARLRRALHQLREVWNYELTASGEGAITPGKMVSALVIFLLGWALAGFVSRLLGKRVFPRLRLEEGASHAFQSLAFYFLLLVAFLTALRMVQIPLTAFAVLGGALAIGVGFGSQNVVNNFISGLILLAERPIKLGDLVEMEGVYGNVERIGLRSTRVRTGDNVHIIVPNALFLENKVINWTHRDPKVRITIPIGIVYGSATREAERLVKEVLANHPQVLAQPGPVVLFRDFGDNALIFEARFWIHMRTMMERLQIESDIRFRIDEVFREAGIVIAFPQRDVHLDTAKPLDVRVVPKED